MISRTRSRRIILAGAISATVALVLTLVPDPASLGGRLIDVRFPLLEVSGLGFAFSLAMIISSSLLAFGTELSPHLRYRGLLLGAAFTAVGTAFFVATILSAEPVVGPQSTIYVQPLPQTAFLVELGVFTLVFSAIARVIGRGSPIAAYADERPPNRPPRRKSPP